MKPIVIIFLSILSLPLLAQDEDLMNLIEEETDNKYTEVSATFKGTRLINGHTIETRDQGVLDFIISHRFGTLNSGVQDLFGLDFAQIRLGLDYAVFDRFTVGVGRSSFNKVYDGFLKYQFLSQSDKMPVSATGFASVAMRTDEFFQNREDYRGAQRFAYTYQVLIARKFGDRLSLQIMPTLVHRNYVQPEQENDLLSLGMGGRCKITRRVTLNMEYYPLLNQDIAEVKDAIAIGVDIETGGHVFQLHFTNAQQMNERGFIGEATGDFFDGDIHFGFNIVRAFDLMAGK